MSETITITSLAKQDRKFTLTFADTSSMVWGDQTVLEEFIDNGKASDSLVRGLLRRIRSSDPTFSNISNISNVTYEQPDVREAT